MTQSKERHVSILCAAPMCPSKVTVLSVSGPFPAYCRMHLELLELDTTLMKCQTPSCPNGTQRLFCQSCEAKHVASQPEAAE